MFKIWLVDVPWPPSETTRFGSRFIDFPNVCKIFTKWHGFEMGWISPPFRALFGEHIEEMASNFVYWRISTIFRTAGLFVMTFLFRYSGAILQFWHSETGQFWGIRESSGELMKWIIPHLACWYVVTNFKTDYIFTRSVDFPNSGAILTLWKGSNLGIIWTGNIKWLRMWHALVSWPPSELIECWSFLHIILSHVTISGFEFHRYLNFVHEYFIFQPTVDNL